MRKILAIIFSAGCIAISCISGDAAQWAFPGSGAQNVSADVEPDSFATMLAVSPEGSLEVFSGSGLAPFVPMQLDRFVISLLDVSTGDATAGAGKETPLPQLQLNAGVKTESYLTDPKSLLTSGLSGNSSDPLQAQSPVVFVGIGLDFNALFLRGSAFLGRPAETIPNKLATAGETSAARKPGLDTSAFGFEASAGYQFTNSVALGGGVGKMTDKNKETDKTEEVYAVYAQAILAVAPGVQVKPEVGQVERVKDKAEPEVIDESFYAGAIWEINF